MKLFISLFVLTTFLVSAAEPTNLDSSQDQQIVEKAVISWADSLFVQHENYKFDHFNAFYTDDYFIQTTRLETYEQKIADLEHKKETGNYTGTEESYQDNLKKLRDALLHAKETIGKIDRVTHYQIHFWSNIKTRDGITVYYELILTLNNNYEITAAIENSAIGKKNSESKIAYKNPTGLVKVVEKS